MREAIESRIREAGIVAILRGDFPLSRLVEIVGAMGEGGITAVEVTLNSTDALEGICRLHREFGDDLVIGAGTVRTAPEVDAAAAAGARFLVSPNYDPESVARSRALDLLHLPGVFTASEAQAAYAAGCRLVKLFPSDALGPAYLKALRAPLDDIGFIAVGGIGERNLGEYIRAGAAGVGVGSALVRGGNDDVPTIRSRAEVLTRALRDARNGGSAAA